jgi:hypothetical protein
MMKLMKRTYTFFIRNMHANYKYYIQLLRNNIDIITPVITLKNSYL